LPDVPDPPPGVRPEPSSRGGLAALGRRSTGRLGTGSDDAAQVIEGSDSDLIEVTVSKGRSLSILERFVLRAITLQAEARGKAVWVR